MKDASQTSRLRQQAEALLRITAQDLAVLSVTDIQHLVRTLQTYQIELELQNEVLRQAQSELQQARDKYHQLYEEAPVGYLTLSAAGRIQQANTRAVRLLGHPQSRLVGHSLFRWCGPAARTVLSQHLQAVFTTRSPQTGELRLELSDGQQRQLQLESLAVPAYDETDGSDRQSHTVIIDLTERRSSQASQANSGRTRSRLVAHSPAMQTVLQQLQRAAPSESSILILGESGTGKEMLAHLVHQHSRRSEQVFLALDCASVPDSLLESELFGYVKGAFTGAGQNKKGLCEEADGGTLFLDEIGDISLAFQAKLLRFLQEGEIRPVGSTKSKRVNVRVLAATNRDLGHQVAAEQFRRDLYYRLTVVPLVLPPLRERRQDILPLVAHFLECINSRSPGPAKTIAPAALYMLTQADWPGNVRELEHTIERSVILSADTEIQAHEVLFFDPLPGDGLSESRLKDARALLKQAERHKLGAALRRAGGNRTQTAKQLGISRATLYDRLKRLDLLGAG